MSVNATTLTASLFPSSAPSITSNIINSSTITDASSSSSFLEAQLAEEEHEFDAQAGFVLNATLIACLLLAYAVKRYNIYALPESAGALLVGVVIGGIARLSLQQTDDDTDSVNKALDTGHGGSNTTNGELLDMMDATQQQQQQQQQHRLELFEFSPEVFFFFLLPPIIFEAGYSLDRKGFFDNIGAITLYAFLGTVISTFVVGYVCYGAQRIGLLPHDTIDGNSPMEALLFGSLISAVDPVATLSIMGNQDLNVDPLLYSLVFGESVLNDAIAISLFKTFLQFYTVPGAEEDENDQHENDEENSNDTMITTSYMTIAMSFVVVSGFSILVGVALGLAPSWLYKHTQLRRYPNLETSLLLCFCYLCYATAEAMSLSGIMALFFQGVVLSHYNTYNLSPRAHVASEQIFSTFATLTETIVFVYMGMGVFTGGFQHWNLAFSLVGFLACLVGRALNIFPLSFLANLCRKGRRQAGSGGGGSSSNGSGGRGGGTGDYKITAKMQMVLWFAGLRGAIAFALAENMPGPHKEVYATATLTICIVTTVFCGGFTERILTVFGMREEPTPKLKFTPHKYNLANGDDDENGHGEDDEENDEDGDMTMNSLSYKPPTPRRAETALTQRRRRLEEGIKGVWNRFDDRVLKPHFGGDDGDPTTMSNDHQGGRNSGSDHSERRKGNGNHDNFDDLGGVRLDSSFASASRKAPPRRHGDYEYEMSNMGNGRNVSGRNGSGIWRNEEQDEEEDEEKISLTSSF